MAAHDRTSEIDPFEASSAPRALATAADVPPAQADTRQGRLERQMVTAVDRERARFGRELHDGLCQSLAGVAALSSALFARLARGPDATACALAAEITTRLSAAIGEARGMARGLGPDALGAGGLETALATLASTVGHVFPVSCTFASDPPVAGLLREVEGHLFRIAQEAVSNAVIHGRARRINVSLRSEDGAGVLAVLDDGVGGVEAIHPRGSGLRTMAQRARLIGASLNVRDRVGSGTAVICSFSCP